MHVARKLSNLSRSQIPCLIIMILNLPYLRVRGMKKKVLKIILYLLWKYVICGYCLTYKCMQRNLCCPVIYAVISTNHVAIEYRIKNNFEWYIFQFKSNGWWIYFDKKRKVVLYTIQSSRTYKLDNCLLLHQQIHHLMNFHNSMSLNFFYITQRGTFALWFYT